MCTHKAARHIPTEFLFVISLHYLMNKKKETIPMEKVNFNNVTKKNTSNVNQVIIFFFRSKIITFDVRRPSRFTGRRTASLLGSTLHRGKRSSAVTFRKP